MILKIIGSIIIIAASSLIGYVFSRDCSRRPHELRTLQGLLQQFETEISYLSDVLTDAFTKISKSSDSNVASFFSRTVEKLEGNSNLNACRAWEMAVGDAIEKTSLNEEDGQILVSFGKMLGNSDLEGQVKNIRLTVNQLKMQEQKAEESRKRNESMFKSLGVLGGIAVVIILL